MTIRVFSVAEHYGARRTGLSTRSGERIGRHDHIARRARFDLLRYLGVLNTLDAVTAFFHHAAHSDGDVGILDHLEQVPFVIFAVVERPLVKAVVNVEAALVVIEKVESPDLVRTVIRAITSANAPVINHDVEAFLVVNGGVDRTNVLTWRGFTMLAKHWLRYDLRVINPFLELLIVFNFESSEAFMLLRRGGIVAVDAQPVHFASAKNLRATDNRNIVFALAGHHTRGAADARIQINGHAPLMDALLFELIERVWIKRQRLDRTFLFLAGHLFCEIFVDEVLVVIRLANDGTPFQRPMVLGANQFMALAGWMNGCAHGKAFGQICT